MSCSSDPVHVEHVTEAVRVRGAVLLQVAGRSMMPWIRPGDVLFIRRTDPHSVTPGEVVLFARNEQLVVHRVIRKSLSSPPSLLVTKGDAVADPDEHVSGAELLGRVTCIYRGWRQINLETPQQIVLGRLLSRLSGSSRFWLPVARLVKRFVFPARKASEPFAAASLPPRNA
jgi:signal peptidase I